MMRNSLSVVSNFANKLTGSSDASPSNTAVVEAEIIDEVNNVTTPQDPSGFQLEAKSLYRNIIKGTGDKIQTIKMWIGDPIKAIAVAIDAYNCNPHLLLSNANDSSNKELMMQTGLLFSEKDLARYLDKHGWAVNPKALPHLVEYLSNERRCAPHSHGITDSCGWQNKNTYMLPDGTTYGSDSKLVRPSAELQGSLVESNTRGTLEGQLQAMQLACGNPWFQFCTSIAFAGPLVKITGCRSVGFNICAKSGRGKTIAAEHAASVWGNPYPLQNWRSTANALENLAIRHNDGFMVLDEIQTVVNADALDEASYPLANGKQKARLNSDSTLKKIRSWAIVYLSTGEFDYETALKRKSNGKIQQSQSGQEVRLISIYAPETDMGLVSDFTAHGCGSSKEYVERVEVEVRAHYGHLGRAYAEKLTDAVQSDPEGFRAYLIQTMDDWKATVEKGGNQVNRVIDSFALVAAAGKWAIEQGLLPWGVDDAFNACRTAYKAFLEGRGSSIDGEDLKILKAILKTVQTQSNRFAAPGIALSSVPNCLGRLVNTRKDDEGNAVSDYDFLSTGLQEICGCDIDRITKAIDDQKWLEHAKNGDNSTKTTIKKEQWRFYRILHDKVREFGMSLDGVADEDKPGVGDTTPEPLPVPSLFDLTL